MGESSTAAFDYTVVNGWETRTDQNGCTSEVQTQTWDFSSTPETWTASAVGGGWSTNGTGQNASFVAPWAGTYMVSFTVEGKNAAGVVLATASASTNVLVSAPSGTIKEISFTGDHPMYQNSTDHGGWGVGPVINDPVWTSSGTNAPVCYTKGSTVSMTVKLDVNGNLPPGQSKTITLLADGPDGLDATTAIDVTGSNTVEVTKSLTTTGTLTNVVYKVTPTFTWKLICGNGTNSAGSSSHTIYVTYGTPVQSDKTIDSQTGENKLTVKRIDALTTAASGSNSLDGVASAIYQWAEGVGDNAATDAWPAGTPPIWYVWTGISGSCIAHANMNWHALALEGISAEARRIYPSTDADIFDREQDGTGNYWLAYNAGSLNNYEGATHVIGNDKWYPGMVTPGYRNAHDTAKGLFCAIVSWQAYYLKVSPYSWGDLNGNSVLLPVASELYNFQNANPTNRGDTVETCTGFGCARPTGGTPPYADPCP